MKGSALGKAIQKCVAFFVGNFGLLYQPMQVSPFTLSPHALQVILGSISKV
ncbi:MULTISPECIES: hypothetical protein [unclassified Pedobacter]|uniref:hypothetical protein n=1 Tax=unclassified Pedobacter TaxID=2628915 RepID=UPI00142190B4|nr:MULTISPECIES: hypothetical protein [unclassified Pedobacter]NII81739.1 hypothetical protein [Pedobacter sp. SG908]NMN35742.1 hypothetical protein [Pedobacter sp. SG918]